MKVLVAGGTGHTGERLVRRLLGCGHEVRVLSRRDPHEEILAALLEEGAIHAPGDCHRRDLFVKALSGCDLLISCAHIRYSESCIDACRATGVVRYLQMSSTRRFTSFPCSTSREVIAGEKAIMSSALEYTILRPTMIFGGQRDANMTRLVAWFRKHRWFPIFGDGRNLVQPIYVEDLLDAFMAAIARPEASVRKVFTLAGPEPLTYERFLRETAAACGVKNPLFIRVPIRVGLLAARFAPPPLVRRGLSAEQIQRMAEDKDADIGEAQLALDFTPQPFAKAIALKVGTGIRGRGSG